ncbi:MAG: hypothetical protein K1X72_23360 [Pyrinomonadaceae bacterium]|nr:hypothetical protein [Pyrinomonadaceae bacterium]
MYLYLESLGKNLIATILGLFLFSEGVSDGVSETVSNISNQEHSTLFLILTITIPSIISAIVTISVEYFKYRSGRK